MVSQMNQVMEALFQHVAGRGSYSMSELQSALNIDENTLQSTIEELCSISHLYQYDAQMKTLVTLADYVPLDQRQILTQLPKDISDHVLMKCSFVTDSTNTDLECIQLRSLTQQGGLLAAVAITEMQRGGRGRRAKKWISPLAKNLYFSFKYHFPQSAFPHLSTLSLRAGIALLEALNSLGIESAKIKWPNDIWVNGQKLAGILVESTITSQGMDVIIGIGVNNQEDSFSEVVGNHPTSCEAVLGQPLNRNNLVAALTSRLYEICQQIVYTPEKLLDLKEAWKLHSCFVGKTVRLISDKAEEIGQEIGIDESGALLIQYADGSIKPHLSGDLSLRAYS